MESKTKLFNSSSDDTGIKDICSNCGCILTEKNIIHENIGSIHLLNFTFQCCECLNQQEFIV